MKKMIFYYFFILQNAIVHSKLVKHCYVWKNLKIIGDSDVFYDLRLIIFNLAKKLFKDLNANVCLMNSITFFK